MSRDTAHLLLEDAAEKVPLWRETEREREVIITSQISFVNE